MGDENLRKNAYWIVLSILAFSLALTYFMAKSDESVARIARTMYTCYSVWRDYERTMKQLEEEEDGNDDREKVMDELHLRSAKRLLNVCLINGGAFIKVGQTISSMNHLLPEEYTSTFECCQDKAPCQSYDLIERVFIQQFGKPPQHFFEEFDPQPLASASLAQVHRAKLLTGEDVVVKIQYNSIEERMMEDIKVLAWLHYLHSKFSRGNMPLKWLLDEFRTNLKMELDFVQEAHHCEKFAHMFHKTGLATSPKIYWNVTSKKVITMEYIDGVKITDTSIGDIASKERIVSLLSEAYGKQIFLDGIVHCDPHPGNIFVRRRSNRYNDVELVFLDHGLYRVMEQEYRLEYNKLWIGLMSRLDDVVKKYAADYSLLDNKATDKEDRGKYQMTISEKSLEELCRLFGSMCLSRQWNPEDETVGMNPRLSKEEQQWIRQCVRDNLPAINLVLSNCPKDLLLLFKVNEHMRSISQMLDTNVNYFSIFTSQARRGIYEHQYQHLQDQLKDSYWLRRIVSLGYFSLSKKFT